MFICFGRWQYINLISDKHSFSAVSLSFAKGLLAETELTLQTDLIGTLIFIGSMLANTHSKQCGRE